MEPGTLAVLWIILAVVGWFVIGAGIGVLAVMHSSQVLAGIALIGAWVWAAFALVMFLINFNQALAGG